MFIIHLKLLKKGYSDKISLLYYNLQQNTNLSLNKHLINFFLKIFPIKWFFFGLINIPQLILNIFFLKIKIKIYLYIH